MKFQLIGYTGSHWINRQVSFWSHSEINHVGVRFYGSPVGYPVEWYYDVKKGPQLLRSATVEKFYTPMTESPRLRANRRDYWLSGRVASAYPVGKVLPCYRKFFLGGSPPPTCARMVSEQLALLGFPVEENFMPGKLIKEFQERYNKCT